MGWVGKPPLLGRDNEGNDRDMAGVECIRGKGIDLSRCLLGPALKSRRSGSVLCGIGFYLF